MKKEDFLVSIACKEESEGLFEKFTDNIVFTGVGKINATYNLFKKLTEMKLQNKMPKYVINFGSCGSKKYRKGSLVYCNKFTQRDMDCSIFGYEKGVTPSDKFSLILEHKNLINDLPNAICGSGDNFVTTQEIEKIVDVVEMEAYALAKVCKIENIDFLAVKYITDGLTETGGEDWNNEVRSSAQVMFNYFKKILNLENI